MTRPWLNQTDPIKSLSRRRNQSLIIPRHFQVRFQHKKLNRDFKSGRPLYESVYVLLKLRVPFIVNQTKIKPTYTKEREREREREREIERDSEERHGGSEKGRRVMTERKYRMSGHHVVQQRTQRVLRTVDFFVTEKHDKQKKPYTMLEASVRFVGHIGMGDQNRTSSKCTVNSPLISQNLRVLIVGFTYQ